MPEFSKSVISLFNIYTKRTAPDQGGLLSGKDPTAFNTADPLRIWIIQLGVIMMTTQLLSLVLKKMRQPRVISEVIGGIFLGPTLFGRIPGFTEHIFPADTIPYLSLVANIGLCLFLFLVGLEIDASIIRRNARLSVTVALAGMVIPFGFGAALSIPIYHHFIDESVKFTYFMLFTGVAYSITAFPVLCRILTELKLLDTTVGIVVLSAGVGNDIVGWTLLALSVALVNAGSGLTAVYILLTCVGYALFLLFVVSRALKWLAYRTGSVENGPTMLFMTFTILLLFGSAFFTDVIGVHAIFGESSILIYRKFGGCTLAARFAGFSWREASTIGSLMSCKGLVELIVLNVGLSAGILSQVGIFPYQYRLQLIKAIQRVFSMFVFEAVLLTFMTTPLVSLLYPPNRRVRFEPNGATRQNHRAIEDAQGPKSPGGDSEWKTRFTVVLDKIEHLPGMMALSQLIQPVASTQEIPPTASPSGSSKSIDSKDRPLGIFMDALRLIELSDRTSAVMKSSVADSLLQTDPLLGIFRMFGELHDIDVSTSLAIVPYDDLSLSVAEHAKDNASQLILLPWLPPHVTSHDAADDSNNAHLTSTPFDNLFGSRGDKSASAIHSQFVRGVFAQAKTDVALFVDRGHAPGEARTAGSMHHIFLPFIGGPDDRAALNFVVQLCRNPKITATAIRVIKKAVTSELSEPDAVHVGDKQVSEQVEAIIQDHGLTTIGFPDTVYGYATTQTRLQSETADNLAWSRYASPRSEQHPSHLAEALSRIDFMELQTPVPLHAIVSRASQQFDALVEKRSRLLVVAGRSRRLAVENHREELKELIEEHGSVGNEVKKTIGDVATAFVVSGCKAGLVVVQAGVPAE
ncbi:hypothetical protein HWV62_43888 [Athelia sp. TMB]|nr:hypothetical protein HWV62_43888 [Athelia sp. TMB]